MERKALFTSSFSFRPPTRSSEASRLAEILPEEVKKAEKNVTVSLPAGLDADLKWEQQRAAAEVWVEKGYRIFWEMQLGLFKELKYPLGVQTQFLSLCLSLEHFCETLGKQFAEKTAGLCLYRGSADFSQGFLWDEEQKQNYQHWLRAAGTLQEHPNRKIHEERLRALFCRDVCADYLELMGRHLPDTFEPSLLLDESEIESPLTSVQLTNRERFPRFKLALKNGSFKEEEEQAKVAVCLPPVSVISWIPGLDNCLNTLRARRLSYRVIPEEQLTAAWDGLDYLIVSADFLSQEGRRKLLGFCAAGGGVVSLEKNLGLPHEISMEQLLSLTEAIL
jgi:hypothetical protein